MRDRNLQFALLLFTLAAFFAIALGGIPSVNAQAPAAQHQGSAAVTSDTMTQGAAPMAMPPAESSWRPWCEDTVWSTFNHRVTGVFIFLWGFTALMAGLQWPRRTWVRFAAPLLLFGLVEFLFFRNDPETWPVGPISFWTSLHNVEDLQHRIFLVLILVIAVIELLRASERLPNLLAKFGLPALGLFGSIFLFFHKHGGNEGEMMKHMSDTAIAADPAMKQMMASMRTVLHEHMWFSILGLGLVAAKLLADLGYIKGRWGATIWTVFAICLGVYMMGYVE